MLDMSDLKPETKASTYSLFLNDYRENDHQEMNAIKHDELSFINEPSKNTSIVF
jgi:hypothetical protein